MDKITAQFQARLVLKAFLLGAPKNLADCLCNKLNFLQAYFRVVSSASMHDLRHTVTEALHTVFIHLISQRRICDHRKKHFSDISPLPLTEKQKHLRIFNAE